MKEEVQNKSLPLNRGIRKWENLLKRTVKRQKREKMKRRVNHKPNNRKGGKGDAQNIQKGVRFTHQNDHPSLRCWNARFSKSIYGGRNPRILATLHIPILGKSRYLVRNVFLKHFPPQSIFIYFSVGLASKSSPL
jgi:hypothetical protein